MPRWFPWVFTILFLTPVAWSCKVSGESAAKRKMERSQKKQDREALKEYRAALKRHLKMQDPTTRKRMRKTLRQSKKDLDKLEFD
ncbi:MAG: hypothetical protein FJY10_00165 [Bacteroidetes bacterium]|nr:hypothetical protein [Bacteroidota bacterium]